MSRQTLWPPEWVASVAWYWRHRWLGLPMRLGLFAKFWVLRALALAVRR